MKKWAEAVFFFQLKVDLLDNIFSTYFLTYRLIGSNDFEILGSILLRCFLTFRLLVNFEF